MPKVIHSLQLHTSHQMRSYSCQDHLKIELYLLFGVVGHQGNLGEKGPNTPISSTKSPKIKIQSLQLLILHQMRPHISVQDLCGSNYTCFTGTQLLGHIGETGPEYPNHEQGHMKSNQKSSAPCFTQNLTLLQCQDSLQVELYLFHRYSGIGAIWGNWAQIPQITCRDT